MEDSGYLALHHGLWNGTVPSHEHRELYTLYSHCCTSYIFISVLIQVKQVKKHAQFLSMYGQKSSGDQWKIIAQSLGTHSAEVMRNSLETDFLGELYEYVLHSYSCKKKLHGLSPRANYTDRATAACWWSDCQLLQIEGATWSAWWIPMAVFSIF
jgi:hypothetical protein